MDFKQVEAFVKVAELGSFSKAAEAIFLSQPSVSTYISALEKELTATLINRSTKEVSLTLAGKIFFESAKEILALRNNSIERIKSLKGDFSGEINVLASSVPSQYILPELIARFCGNYPGISFNVKQADTFEVVRGIASQQAEIGFSGGMAENSKCTFHEFASEEMVLIGPNNFGLTHSRKYFLRDIMYSYPYVAREKGSGTRAEYENFFADNSIDISKLKPRASFDNTQSIINAVVSGLGFSIVSEIAARAHIDQKLVTLVNLEEELPKRKLYYVLKKSISASHLVDLFVGFLQGSSPNVSLVATVGFAGYRHFDKPEV